MRKLGRLCAIVEDELIKIADKGLTMNSLDTTYKLVDIYKDIKTVEAMEDGGYSERYDDRYDDVDSYGRRHYVRGHYSMDGRDSADMADKLDDLMRDASPEDRRVLERFAGKLRGV